MLDADNVERIIAGYDVILDGTDTFETRYILNDAAVAANIPVVHASVFRFEGQLTVFKPYEGPCYRCLYPTPPPPELAPGCSVAGVLGVVPGIMGLLQTNEALKLLLGIGETLAGRLLLFDALDTSFTELRLRRDPAARSAPMRRSRARGRPAAAARAVAPFGRSRTSAGGRSPLGGATMSVVRIPPVLRAKAGGNKQVESAGATVGEVLTELVAQYPALGAAADRRRRAEPVRQRLPQRPGHPLPPGARDAGRRARQVRSSCRRWPAG